MPLMWNENYKGLLGRNFNLAKQILLASLRKLKKNKDQFMMIHEVFDNQRKMGVIEPIENLDSFIADFPESCFLSHMPVFRHDKDTTKCRVVFLSNLAGKDANKTISLSNNQCMMSGSSLNSKISISRINLKGLRDRDSFASQLATQMQMERLHPKIEMLFTNH